MGILIETPQLLMEIKLVSLDSLYIHEEIIPKALKELKSDLISTQVIKHPMIADSKTLVVLDGMHRYAALRSLSCELAPVCLVDYQNPVIEISAWHREFAGNTSFTKFLNLLSANPSFDLKPTTMNQAFEYVQDRKAFAALANGDTAFLLRLPTISSMKSVYEEISNIETIANQIGYSLVYSTQSDAIESIKSGTRPVLIVPSLTKEEVIEGALKHQLFTHKTTRHLVPARPLFINVPLSWLKDSDLDHSNQKLEEYLKAKEIIVKESGTIINGRRYEERCYIFSD